MLLSLVNADILVLLIITLNAAVLSRNSSQLDLMPSDQGSADNKAQKECPNWQGVLVADGEKYVPHGNDMCMQCTCDRGYPVRCHSVACSPPLQCSSPKQVIDACCEYICLDDKISKDRNVTDIADGKEKDDGENITNLSLRLIASTVTSFLVLALLLFMVHRLRQRRLLLAMRRFETQSRQGHADDTDSDPYIPDAFLSLECPPYTDPPPPYSPPKPPQILPGEQPPPYDEINHNIDETNADENRNQIRGVNSSSGSGRNVHGNVTGQRRTGSRNQTQVETGVTCQPDHQRRSFEPGHQRAGIDNIRPPNTLPAYASTDVVEGLGVVISPGSDLVCYNAGWNTWLGARTGHDRHVVQTEIRQQRSPPAGSLTSSTSNTSRAQTMPTTTAFQRFSNIFRRDSWKVKHWRQQGRPSSDFSRPSHYATIPRNEQSPRSRVGSSQNRGKNVSRPFSGGFPDTLYLSYDTGQVTYTLGAISPSTSSSNSSEHYDQNNLVSTTIGSTTTSTTPGASSSGNSISPPDGSCLIGRDFLLSPVHRQQFHDDLCRHLPPIQLSDTNRVAISDSRERTCVSTSTPEGIYNTTSQPQCSRNLASDQILQNIPEHTLKNNAFTGEVNLHGTRPIPTTHSTGTSVSSSPSSSTGNHSSGHQQQSLASFMRSHPSASIIDSRDHSLYKASVSPQLLLRSDCPVIHPTSGQCSQVLSCSQSQISPQYLSTVLPGNSKPSSAQGSRSSKDIARKSQELTASLENRSSAEVTAQVTRNNEESLAVAATPGNCRRDIQVTPDHLHAIAQEFASSCQLIPLESALYPPVTAVMTCTAISTSPFINISPTAAAAMAYTPASSSPSPSPPTVSASTVGVLRRSQSGASQASMFSVCSETGEKKLKASDIFENDTGIVSTDSCYSDHHSLSRTQPCHYQEPYCVPTVKSVLPIGDSVGVLWTGINEHPASGNPTNCGSVCGSKCLQNCGSHAMYSQENIPLPFESSSTASGGLVTTVAFPCIVSSTSSHPPTISNSSVLSSCGDSQTYPADEHQNENSWNSSSYNFNTSVEVDKGMPVKDVPSFYEGDRMTQSVNIPPLPSLNTPKSGKILKHNLSANNDPSSLPKPGKSHEVMKKLKKKRTKDRNLSSPQFCNTVRHTSSPKHHFKIGEWNKEASSPHKSECATKDKEAVVRPLKPGDKKHRGHSVVNRQHMRLNDSLNSNKVMTRSAGDTPAAYGNADVYRSIGSEGLLTSMTYQLQTFVPWNQQGATGGCDNSFNFGTTINDLNQPPSYLKTQADNSSPCHVMGMSDGLVGKGDLRKKSGHKRQSSTGERAGHLSSPNRYKSRPKSLAAPDAHLNEKRVDVNLPRPSLTTCDFSLVGKGARSGFGHDLNFDDQSGIADLHIQEADFGSRRVSLGQDVNTQSSVGPTRKLLRAEGSNESTNITTKLGNASYGYHPGSRSGLSNELSFTSRPGHNKKRQSLPSGIGGAAFIGVQDRTNVGASTAIRSRQGEDNHAHIGQVKGDRSSGLSERRLDKPVLGDDYTEATSYV